MKNMKTRFYGHKGIIKKKSKHETHLQSMQEKLNLSEGIEWGVEEDLDRST